MTAATVALLACTAVTGAVATCPCPAWCLPDQSGHQPLPGTITVSLSPGAANCTTIQGALELTRQGYRGRYTIEIAPGIYNEKVVVMANRPPVTLVGRTEEVDGVVVRWQDCDGCSTTTDPLGEWFDQTLWVGAADFRAINMTFVGSTRSGGRNMALQVAADRAFFSGCRFYGSGADTIYGGGADHRAFFTRCFVNGTDDFLWGVGSVVWVDSTIVGTSTVTAHKGTQVDRNGRLGGCTGDALFGRSCTAYLMLNCRLPRPPGFKGVGSLGRPWRWMATVLFHGCWMDDHIPNAGWTTPPHTTRIEAANLTFAEFNTTGPGAAATRPFPAQVWTSEQVATWTVARVLRGWDPLTPSQQPYCWDVPPFHCDTTHGPPRPVTRP